MSAAAASPSRSRLVDGEFVFTAEDFRRIAGILYADAGISLADGKATLVYSRLAKRLRTLGLASFRDYCTLIGEQDGLDERQEDAGGPDHQRHPLLPRAAPLRPPDGQGAAEAGRQGARRRPGASVVCGLLDRP